MQSQAIQIMSKCIQHSHFKTAMTYQVTQNNYRIKAVGNEQDKQQVRFGFFFGGGRQLLIELFI